MPDVAVEPLMESVRYPVCSPAFKTRAGLRHPEDLLGVTLFHDEVSDAWGQWFRLAGIQVPESPRGPPSRIASSY